MKTKARRPIGSPPTPIIGPNITKTHTSKCDYWDHARNLYKPEQYTYSCNDQAYWCCPKNKDHHWTQRIIDFLKRQTDCMFCARLPVKESIRLSVLFPKLAKEWHPDYNDHITPETIETRSARPVWWKCSKSSKHIYCAPVKSRTKDGLPCPFCAAKTSKIKNSFGQKHQDLTKYWNWERNHNLDPVTVSCDSPLIVYFHCQETMGSDDPHSIRTTVEKAAKEGIECRQCARPYPYYGSLAQTNPKLAAQWHKTKNKKLTPSDVTAGSAMLVWWQCKASRDHHWRTPVCQRSHGNSGCPFCCGLKPSGTNSLGTNHPDLLEQWDKKRNGILDPYSLSSTYHPNVWWVCTENPKHRWQASPAYRARTDTGCPYCNNRIVTKENSLAGLYPEVAKLWHKKKNGVLKPTEVAPKTNKTVWWKCDKGPDHEWQAQIGSRVHGNGCPFCCGLKFSVTQTLAWNYPKVAKQWHPTLNGTATPKTVRIKSNKPYWWQCSRYDDHAWTSKIMARVNSLNSCTLCARLKVSSKNNIAASYPEVAKEWHPTKNKGITPKEVAPKSNTKFFWKCSKNSRHVWETTPNNRIGRKTGCPFCYKDKNKARQ